MRMSRFVIAGSIFFAICTVSSAIALAAAGVPTPLLSALPSPAASPSPADASFNAVAAEILSVAIWISAAVTLIVIASVFFYSRRNAQVAATTDTDLEASRIVYGFWLIIGSLILILAVVIVTVNIFRPANIGTADVLAVITSVTGVVGTLIAAFFGVQAAGAGRSQALTALTNLQAASQPAATENKFDPSFGPHAGNTRISITGNGFTRANAVNFGTVQGLNFEGVNDGLVRVTTPPAPPGTNTADVAICFDGVTPPNRSVGTFYYYTVDPSQAAAVQGNAVQIRGSGFTNATEVRFGTASVPAPAPDVNGYLNITLPARPPGVNPGDEVDVTVVFPVDSPTNVVTVGKFTW